VGGHRVGGGGDGNWGKEGERPELNKTTEGKREIGSGDGDVQSKGRGLENFFHEKERKKKCGRTGIGT